MPFFLPTSGSLQGPCLAYPHTEHYQTTPPSPAQEEKVSLSLSTYPWPVLTCMAHWQGNCKSKSLPEVPASISRLMASLLDHDREIEARQNTATPHPVVAKPTQQPRGLRLQGCSQETISLQWRRCSRGAEQVNQMVRKSAHKAKWQPGLKLFHLGHPPALPKELCSPRALFPHEAKYVCNVS